MVIEEGILWDVTHSGVTVTFKKGDSFEEADQILVEGDDEGGILVFSIDIFGH